MLLPVAVIELVLMDETGSTGAAVFKIPASSTVEIGDAAALALASLIAPVSDAVLIKYRISWKVNLAPTGMAEDGAAIVHTGVFILSTDSPNPLAIVTIPAIKSSLLLTEGFSAGYGIDRLASDVIAFIDELLALNASNPFGDVITGIDAAYLQSRV